MGFLRVLMFLLRLIFGMTYLLSGYFKLVDPAGTQLVIMEYLTSFHLESLEFISAPLSIIIPATEFVIGIAILMCLRMKYTSLIAMIMTLFFTILTFFSATFDLVSECGCFGEAIPADNWETFVKNIILTLCIVPIFLFRNKFKKVATAPAEWILLGVYGVVAMGASLYSFTHIPFLEFGQYKVGTNISVKLENATDNTLFQNYFIYEKDGEEKEFSIDELPDDSWNFVRSESEYLGDISDLDFKMDIYNLAGVSIADEIAHRRSPSIIFSLYKPEDLNEKYWEKLSATIDSVLVAGGMPYVLTHQIDQNITNAYSRYPHIEPYLAIADRNTMISMVRSNGGVIYIDDGIVVKKWASWKYTPKEIFDAVKTDSEEITLLESVRQTLVYELSILIIFLIIILFRYISGIIYGKKIKIIQLPKIPKIIDKKGREEESEEIGKPEEENEII